MLVKKKYALIVKSYYKKVGTDKHVSNGWVIADAKLVTKRRGLMNL
jgi:hypothetical protein